MSENYDGPVCYQDGWHYSVDKDENDYDVPGEKLYLQEDGTYRFATPDDMSWADRHHKQFKNVELA